MTTITTDQPTSAPPPTSTPVLIAKLAAAITMDDDRAWRRMYMPGEAH